MTNDSLDKLIEQAIHLGRIAPPGDARHALILLELLQLQLEQAGHYKPGPRFGLGPHKPLIVSPDKIDKIG